MGGLGGYRPGGLRQGVGGRSVGGVLAQDGGGCRVSCRGRYTPRAGLGPVSVQHARPAESLARPATHPLPTQDLQSPKPPEPSARMQEKPGRQQSRRVPWEPELRPGLERHSLSADQGGRSHTCAEGGAQCPSPANHQEGRVFGAGPVVGVASSAYSRGAGSSGC